MEVYSILRRVSEGPRAAILATIVGIEGHAYRKPGAMMLIALDGDHLGTLSPGCLEADLEARASAVWASGKCEQISYNMRPEEDAMWGEAVGCGGVIEVLLEPIRGRLRECLLAAYCRIQAGDASELLRLRGERGLRYELRELEAGSSTRQAREGEVVLFALRLEPQPRVVLFGAGGDAEPICGQIQRLGFRLAVADWRSALLTEARFPQAELAVGSPSDVIRSLRITAADYVLVCGHQLQQDRRMLEGLLLIQPNYVGVMGSARRIQHLFEGLPMPPYVKAPIGLAIGAQGPEEIAISIAAELIAVRHAGRAAKEGDGFANCRHLSGSGSEPENGATEAIPGACAW